MTTPSEGWRPASALHEARAPHRREILCRFSWQGRDGKTYSEHDVCLIWPDGILTDRGENIMEPGERETLTAWMPIPSCRCEPDQSKENNDA